MKTLRSYKKPRKFGKLWDDTTRVTTGGVLHTDPKAKDVPNHRGLITTVIIVCSVMSLTASIISAYNSYRTVCYTRQTAQNTRSDPWIAAGLYDSGTGIYVKELVAKPGDIVDAHMQVRNTTGCESKMGIGLTLTSGLSLVPDSARLNSSVYREKSLGDITETTMNIGLFSEFDNSSTVGWAEVVYQVKIAEDYVPDGTDRLEICNAVTGYGEDDKIKTDTEVYYTYITVTGE